MDVLQYWKDLKIQKKCALVSTFLFGILAHGPMLFNKFSNRDDLRYLFTGGITISSGRWMIYVIEKLKNILFQDSVYSVPVINSIFTFLCIAASLCILIDLFKLKSQILCILSGGLMVCIPVIACMLGNMYITQYFALAILFAVSGAALICRGKKWYHVLCGILLAAFSVGIYQAFIPSILTILLLDLIGDFSDAAGKDTFMRALKKSGIIIASCLGFMIVYAGLLKFFCFFTHTELSGYKGIGTSTSIPLAEYISRTILPYREFFFPERGTYYDVFPGGSRYLYILSVILFVIFFVMMLWKVLQHSKPAAFCCLLLGLLIPLAVNFIFVMVDPGYCYAMMVYGYAIYFIGFFWLFEKVQPQFKPGLKKLSEAGIAVIFALILIVFWRFDNICYMRLEMYQAQMTRFCTELIARMQSTENYRSSMRVAYIGEPMLLETDTTVPEIDELNYIHVSPYFGFRQLLNTTEPWREFMKIWCEFQAWEVDNVSYYRRMPEVKEMPKYPDEGSIRVIGDTLVVKFRD